MKTKQGCCPQTVQAPVGSGPALSRPARKKIWHGLRAAAVLLLLLGGGGAFGWLVHIAAEPATGMASPLAAPARPGFYSRNKLWLADARTLTHMFSYLLRPEIEVKTNLVVNG
jgi:hypothetical protein